MWEVREVAESRYGEHSLKVRPCIEKTFALRCTFALIAKLRSKDIPPLMAFEDIECFNHQKIEIGNG